MPSPDAPIGEINFYCRRIQKKLAGLGLKTARDLLFYYPFRYEDLSNIKKISELKPGEAATIRARVELIRNYRSPRQHKKITEAIVRDASGKIKILWFNQWYLTETIKTGEEYFFSAKISANHYGDELISPDYEKASEAPTHTARLVPIYPATEGLSQKQIRTAVKSALPAAEKITDYLPEEVRDKNFLPALGNAVLGIHFPDSAQMAQEAMHRLAFDELFLAHLKNYWLKRSLEKKKSIPLAFHKEKISSFVSSLPFRLTDTQRKAAWEILQDTGKNSPMNRLLNGDVGSGKTLVAAIAMYNAALSGAQAAFLAPTEILAKQHYNTFCQLFNNLGVKIGLYTRNSKITNYELRITNYKTITDASDIVIGTHALIRENIKFKNLGLAVVDEQHRFGVEQRSALSACTKNECFPHLLSMTATPIPRTLTLVMYGDLELSILDQMPAGRKIIKTIAVLPEKRMAAYDFIKKEIAAGRQAFVICPLIDPSDASGAKSVTQEYEKLKKEIFPELAIGMLHGKLKSAEKDEIMSRFKSGETKILVSTSVVEVGVDIPNATIIMIEGAERFGLAQLHQFRGRVGRGEHQSYCLLFSSDGKSTERLKAMETINDGFRLAELDLKLRGPGAVYGTEQSGKIDFRLADMNNTLFVKRTADAARNLLVADPDLKKYPVLREYLEIKLERVHLE
jgi:ATP-dependent DNA helicase RecG